MKTTPLAAVAASIVLFASAARSDSPDVAATEREWLFSATKKWQSPFSIPEETKEAHEARRQSIVDAAYDVAHNEDMPSLFPSSKNGRALTALFVLAVFRYESHYDVRVQSMHCKGLPKGSCDGGRAYCLGQVHPEDVPQLAEQGWSGSDLETDLKKCIAATIWRLDAARRSCASTPLEGGDRFSSYASGRCEANSVMKSRYKLATDWVSAHPLVLKKESSKA